MRSTKDFHTGCYYDNQKGKIQTRISIETDRKISQGRWIEGQQRNNQKLDESGVEWRCWKRRKVPLLPDSQRKNGYYSRGSIDTGNSKTGVMFYLVTNRRIKCSISQTHAMPPFGVRKKKMFLSPRRSSLVRLFLRGEVGPYDSLRINATTLCTSAYIK